MLTHIMHLEHHCIYSSTAKLSNHKMRLTGREQVEDGTI